MSGIPTDETVDVAGAPGCSFCKVHRSLRAYMFINEARDTIICDVCITALNEKLAGIDPHPYSPQGKPN